MPNISELNQPSNSSMMVRVSFSENDNATLFDKDTTDQAISNVTAEMTKIYGKGVKNIRFLECKGDSIKARVDFDGRIKAQRGQSRNGR